MNRPAPGRLGVTDGHRKAPMNRLSEATSPYLLQHAGNPVDWWPWSDEAFAQARARDVPVLLSVGYAACHWCHVMAHESFEDPDTATLAERAAPLRGQAPAAGLAALCDQAVATLAADYDTQRGGFGGAPKFPPSMVLEFLLRHSERPGGGRDDEKARPGGEAGGEAD